MKTEVITLQLLLQDIVPVAVDPSCMVSAITSDSRQVKPGSLFIACLGGHVDGRDYMQQAIDNGAVAVIYEENGAGEIPWQASVPVVPVVNLVLQQGVIASRFYGEPSHKMKVIGVTGTNGKTSCTQFISQALAMHNKKCAVIGTMGYGFPPQLNKTTHTTPDALVLHQLLHNIAEQRADYVAMEVSSHALVQHRVSGVNFNVAVYTQLSRDHLDYHGNMENYAKAKTLLFEQPGLQHAVINIDDELGLQLAERFKKTLNVITYSANNNALHRVPAIRATNINALTSGFQVQVSTPWGEGEFSTALLGRFNISNLLALVGVQGILQVPMQEIMNILPKVQTVSGRMQLFNETDQPAVVVDYSHTPDALFHALRALREHCQGRLWCVFGCGGERDRGKRTQMAQIAEQYSDVVIVTNDNPRGEVPERIADEIVAGFQHPEAVTVDLDRGKAIAYAILHAASDDIVLVAGKGHEDYQLIGDKVLPFSDSEVVMQQLSMGVKK